MTDAEQEDLMKSVGLGVCADCAVDNKRTAAGLLVGGTSLCVEHGVRARQIQRGVGL